jgi:hypothetical protein
LYAGAVVFLGQPGCSDEDFASLIACVLNHVSVLYRPRFSGGVLLMLTVETDREIFKGNYGRCVTIQPGFPNPSEIRKAPGA